MTKTVKCTGESRTYRHKTSTIIPTARRACIDICTQGIKSCEVAVHTLQVISRRAARRPETGNDGISITVNC